MEDGPELVFAAACKDLSDPRLGALFWIPTNEEGESLRACNSPYTFPEPNSCYLRELTANPRMRWIKLRWGREYKAIFWKHT